MQQIAYLFGGVFGLLSIILGAFGSHLLKKKWSKEILESFEIGVKYQMYHALFLILIASTLTFTSTIACLAVGFAIAGICLFSGSIYGICYFKSKNIPIKFLGPLTPLGGLCLVFAWLFFTIAVL